MLPEKSASPSGSGTPVASGRLERGGGPRMLEDGRVVLADTAGGRLLQLPAESAPEADFRVLRELPVPLLGVAPLAGRHGVWLAAARDGFALLPPAPGREPDWLARGGPFRCTASDPAGRMWAGTEQGGVVRLTDGGRITEAVPAAAGVGAGGAAEGAGAGETAVGGLAFSPDGGTLYVAARDLHAYDVDAVTGAVRFRRTLARVALADGRPGAIATDGFGRLWCALYGGATVRCLGPDGRTLVDVPVPAWQPSGVCLTGDTMLVTTDREGLDAHGPLDGAVLELTCTAPPVRAAAAVLTR